MISFEAKRCAINLGFQQILCRSLGSTNFLQPHAFLPSEFVGNERLRCGSGILTPMSLSAWVERDPFHKEAIFLNVNSIPTNDDFGPETFGTFSSTTQRPQTAVTGNIDFETESPVLITAKPTRRTSIDNKLDFSTSTTKRRKKRTTTTARQSIVDDKLDFDMTAKRHDREPDSLLAKTNRNSTVKRSTSNKRKKPKDTVERRSDDSTDFDFTRADKFEPRRLFLNEDNATKYLNNRPIRPRLDEIESRGTYDNDDDENTFRPSYEYSSRPSTYYPPYPPLNQPYASERPNAYGDNRPNFADIQSQSRPTKSPISNKHSTPFSYDTYQGSSGSINAISPQSYFENMANPLYVSPNRISNRPIYKRPTYSTTRKMDLSTFLIVDTTRRTMRPNYIDYRTTTKKPFYDTKLDVDYQPSYSSQAPSIIYPPIASSSFDNDQTDFSYFDSPSSTNKFSTKKPFSSDSNNPNSVFSHDDSDDSDESFDGYLRPEASFYIPSKDRPNPTYTDYTTYNYKPEKSTTAKFYYIQNVLHKFVEEKSGKGLYDREPTKRYAEFYDKHLRDKSSDDRTLTDNDDDEYDTTDDIKLEGRSKNGPQNIFLVPFKLLTKIERPDNWVITDKTADQDLKTRLPEVPPLRQDSNVAKELPMPIFGTRGG